MLSLKAQYGLRAIIALAAHYGRGPLQAKEIAASQGVPVRYLELLLSQLRRVRLIEATRGKNGGYVLSKKPNEITVWDIVTSFEGKALLFQPKEAIESPVHSRALSFIWRDAEKKLIEYLDSLKISQVLEIIRSDKEMYFI
jgi:Rrf2 family protein